MKCPFKSRSLWKGFLGVSPGALINNAGVSRPRLKGLDLLWPKYSTRRQSYVSMLVVNTSPFYIRVTRVGWINHKSAFGAIGYWWMLVEQMFVEGVLIVFFWGKYHWVLIDSLQVQYITEFVSRNLFVHVFFFKKSSQILVLRHLFFSPKSKSLFQQQQLNAKFSTWGLAWGDTPE